jgi:NAD(P)-dependent dehydrogenase (short-subunit alcohol dehydrogenase family)
MANKVALVTGAGGGVGRATSILFAREGARVLCADKNEEGLKETLGMISDTVKSKDRAAHFVVDVSSAKDVERMVQECEKKFGALHVLFNNAGIMHHADDDAVTTPEDVWDLTMNVNVKGVWFGCKYGIPAIRRGALRCGSPRPWGR